MLHKFGIQSQLREFRLEKSSCKSFGMFLLILVQLILYALALTGWFAFLTAVILWRLR